MRKRSLSIALAFTAAMILAGCASKPSIAGKWVLDGPIPTQASLSPTIIGYDFEPNGKLAVTYIPAKNPMALMFGAQPKATPITDSSGKYEDEGDGKLELREGSTLAEYQYKFLKDGTLSLAVTSGGVNLGATAFRRADK